MTKHKTDDYKKKKLKIERDRKLAKKESLTLARNPTLLHILKKLVVNQMYQTITTYDLLVV